MADRTGFRVTGLRENIRALQAIGAEVDDLKDAFAKIAAEAARRAAGHAPKKAGRLAASIRGNRAKSSAFVTAGRAAVPYAAAQNYGWAAHNIEPSGFMQKASDEIGPRAVELLEADIDAAIRAKGLK